MNSLVVFCAVTAWLVAIHFATRKILFRQLQSQIETIADILPVTLTRIGLEWLLLLVYSGVTLSYLFVSIGLALGVIAVLTGLVVFALRYAKSYRHKQFLAQLPDTLGAMALSLRSGMNVSKALETVILNSSAPIATQLSDVVVQYQRGRSLADGFARMAGQMRCEEVSLVASAIKMSMEVGGNLAETLDTLALTIRSKIQMEQKISAITSMGKAQGWVVGLCPFVIGAYLFQQEPQAMSHLFTTWYGISCVMFIVLMLMLAIFFIRKIINIDI